MWLCLFSGWPYKCNQCDYASSHVFSLRTHLKTHSEEKSNKCDFIAGIPFEDTFENIQWRKVNPIGCGGGLAEPPLSYKCGSSKNAQRKSCWFFFTFPKYVNGVLETTFCSQITFGLARRGQKWSKLAYFHKGGPCREQYEAKIHDTNRCQLQHVAHNFWVLFVL